MTVPQHITQRRFAISKLPETAYGVPYTDDADFVDFVCKDKTFADDAPSVADNKEYSTGYRQATEQWIVAHELTKTYEFDVCSEIIGRLLLAAFGAVVSTQPDSVGAPTVWKHVFTIQDLTVSRQLPSFTGVEQLKPAIDRRLVGLVMEALTLKGEGSQRLQGSANFRGSGKLVSPSGVDIDPATGLNYFYESQVTFKLDDGVSVNNFANAPNRLNSWQFGIANQLLADDGYRPGAARFQEDGNPDSGETRSEMLIGDQTFNPSFNARLLSDSTLFDAITTQKEFDGLWDIVGKQIVAVDTTDDTQGGDFNVLTNPVTVDKADYPGITPVVGDYYKIGNEILRVSAVAMATFTLERGQLGTAIAVHADAVSIFKLYHNRLIVEAFRMPFKTRKIADRNGLVSLDITPNVLFDVDNNRDVRVTLYNTVASYTS